MQILFAIMLDGGIVGIVVDFLFTICILSKKTIEEAAKLKAFSIAAVGAAVISALFAAVISAAVLRWFCPDLTDSDYIIGAAMGAISALSTSVLTDCCRIMRLNLSSRGGEDGHQDDDEADPENPSAEKTK
jgi:hypothetical protein